MKTKDTRQSLPRSLLGSRRTLKRLAQVSITQDRSGEGEKRLKRPSKSWGQTVKQIHGAVSQGV